MSNLPVPKFYIGQKVWLASTETKSNKWPCPDCKDSREWTTTSPVGEQFKIECPRCIGYSPRDLPSLSRNIRTPYTSSLTIGSVRLDTAARNKDECISYMCHETGVGSGSIYYEGCGERGLYGSLEEAQKAADRMSQGEQKVWDNKPVTLIAKEFSKFPMKVSLKNASKADNWHAWDRARSLREAIDMVLEKETLDENVRELLEDAIEEKSWITPHPIDNFLDAVEDLLADQYKNEMADSTKVQKILAELRGENE